MQHTCRHTDINTITTITIVQSNRNLFTASFSRLPAVVPSDRGLVLKLVVTVWLLKVPAYMLV